jgi:hypothetical protein
MVRSVDKKDRDALVFMLDLPNSFIYFIPNSRSR